ncbi:hypothetical protein IPN41_02565 [Candidatus Falkowbacteria bacterium]|nr:MAG: hypothetical protein IPN41_02565 [Candidatus Falkowbacteria bacterium]
MWLTLILKWLLVGFAFLTIFTGFKDGHFIAFLLFGFLLISKKLEVIIKILAPKEEKEEE